MIVLLSVIYLASVLSPLESSSVPPPDNQQAIILNENHAAYKHTDINTRNIHPPENVAIARFGLKNIFNKLTGFFKKNDKESEVEYDDDVTVVNFNEDYSDEADLGKKYKIESTMKKSIFFNGAFWNRQQLKGSIPGYPGFINTGHLMPLQHPRRPLRADT